MRGLIAPVCLALLALGFAIPGCSQPAHDPGTMTNEQGCTRKRGGPQDPSATPPPLMDACLGPYLLRVPANYFDDQMGPYFDGSFGFALEYPGLEAFAPGERSHLSLDVSTRTVDIGYTFIDRVPVGEPLRLRYTLGPEASYRPEKDLATRIKGEAVYGLVPYYADLDAYRAFYRGKGYAEDTPVMQAKYYNDWFVVRGTDGTIATIIECTSREITKSGVDYRDGKLIRSADRPLPECTQTFILPKLRTLVEIRYVRVALPDWRRMEKRAREALAEFMVNKPEAKITHD